LASVERSGSQWRARWRTPAGGSRSKNFRRKIDAERHATNMEHTRLSGSYVDPSAGRITFKSYAEAWRASQVHRPSTSTQIETNLRRHVYPRIGSRPVGAIRSSEIQALVKELSVPSGEREALAPSTIGVIYTWTSTIFSSAVEDRVIAQSPCRGIRLPEVPHRRVIPPTLETVQTLAEAVPERYRALIILGAGTGVRISEALGLTEDRIDSSGRTVTIDRQLTRVVGAEPVFGPVKDKKNRPRTIPLPDVVVNVLAEHCARWKPEPCGLVFTNERGGPIARSTFSDVWRRAADPLGIPSGDGFHILRHFYASLLIHHGESVKVVQERLGHSSAQMTLDVYSHLWPDSEDETRTAVDSVLLEPFVSASCHMDGQLANKSSSQA